MTNVLIIPKEANKEGFIIPLDVENGLARSIIIRNVQGSQKVKWRRLGEMSGVLPLKASYEVCQSRPSFAVWLMTDATY